MFDLPEVFPFLSSAFQKFLRAHIRTLGCIMSLQKPGIRKRNQSEMMFHIRSRKTTNKNSSCPY